MTAAAGASAEGAAPTPAGTTSSGTVSTKSHHPVNEIVPTVDKVGKVDYDLMADKTVRFEIDADVWNEFRALAMLRGETAKAALANLVMRDVQEGRKRGAVDQRRSDR